MSYTEVQNVYHFHINFDSEEQKVINLALEYFSKHCHELLDNEEMISIGKKHAFECKNKIYNQNQVKNLGYNDIQILISSLYFYNGKVQEDLSNILLSNQARKDVEFKDFVIENLFLKLENFIDN